MSVPSHIERLLEGYKVPYSVTEMVGAMAYGAEHIVPLKPYNTAHATVLKNEDGNKIIAISRQDTLLDIRRINSVFEGKFEPLLGEGLLNFMRTCGVNAIPALPALNNLPTIIDSGLLEYEMVYLDIGLGTQYMQLDQKSFQQLLGDAKIENIVAPLSNLEIAKDPKNDISNITQSVSLFTERRIKQRLEETLEFPPLPATAEKIIRLRVNPNADISDLTDIVELDASLSAQVVSWAASPYYSAPGSIKSIHDAIVRVLGFDMVLNLSLGLSLGGSMKMPKEGPHGCMPYFQQSVYVAAATEALITCIPRAQRPSFGTAYLAGLLNNFGYLIIAEVFNSHFKTICQHIDANPQASVRAVEQHIIGVDRDQLAGWLMEYWHMPENICHALRHQANPNYDGDGAQYALLLYVANKLLQQRGLIVGASKNPIEKSVFKRLHLDPTSAGEAIDTLLGSSEELQIIARQMAG